MASDTHHTTMLLARVARGESGAVEALLPAVYEQLHAIAAARMRDEDRHHTLQPTALVHEAFLRLIDQRSGWEDRARFYGLAAELMRRVLVDHARARQAQKRGGGRLRVTMHDVGPSDDGVPQIDLLALDEALEKLATLSPRQAQVVQLRFFGGLTTAEVADSMQVNRSTVTEDWRIARAWLGAELQGGGL